MPRRYLWRHCSHRRATSWSRRTTRAMTPRPCHYHPYLIADQQSKDMIDALTAARTALPLASLTTVKDNGQLFITGYSQGGYVAMATHRAMQAAGMNVTASAPMSGPYALAAFVDAVFYGEVNGGAPVSSTLLLSAYQTVYGNIYANADRYIRTAICGRHQTLLPSTTPRSQLYAQGKLPEYALFSATPPAPAIRRDHAAHRPGGSCRGVCARIRRRQFAAEQLSPQLSAGCAGESRRRLPHDDDRSCCGGAGTALAPGAAKERLAKLGSHGSRSCYAAAMSTRWSFFSTLQLMQGYWAAQAPSAAVERARSGGRRNPERSVRQFEAGFCDRESARRRDRRVARRDRRRRTGGRRGLSRDVGRAHLLRGDPVIFRGSMIADSCGVRGPNVSGKPCHLKPKRACASAGKITHRNLRSFTRAL